MLSCVSQCVCVLAEHEKMEILLFVIRMVLLHVQYREEKALFGEYMFGLGCKRSCSFSLSPSFLWR